MFNKSLLIPSFVLAAVASLGAKQIQAEEQQQEWEFQAVSMLLTQSSVSKGGNNLERSIYIGKLSNRQPRNHR